MESRVLKIGIVGASSLLGKELAEELGGAAAFAAADVVLLDEEEVSGQVAAIGDEAAFLQRIEPGSFEGLDLCFFAGTKEETLKHWKTAQSAGAGVVDLTDALGAEDRGSVRAPWVSLDSADASERSAEARRGKVVIPAHPVAVMLGLVAARCRGLGLTGLAATVLEPASERGQAGWDAMHQQTVSLLSFQAVPREEYDAQVAFNLLPSLGAGARVKTDDTRRRIANDYSAMEGGGLPDLALQLVLAPVFHGYAISLLLEFHGMVGGEQIAGAIAGEHIEVIEGDSEPPSNVSAAGQASILAQVNEGRGKKMWVWMTADNLKLRALQAIACAAELQGMRGEHASRRVQ